MDDEITRQRVSDGYMVITAAGIDRGYLDSTGVVAGALNGNVVCPASGGDGDFA